MMAVFVANEYAAAAAAITLICVALLTPGWAQNISHDSRTAVSYMASGGGRACSNLEFKCNGDGECIPNELLCDGAADCLDESDETKSECSKPERICSDESFRCNYGACVDKGATCNGVRDCIDNSDEILSKCPGISAANPKNMCGPKSFRCKDGQCMNATFVCNGVVDCTDGSDETFVSCGSFPCSQHVFRCNYGACIPEEMTCNNVSDCVDGSDEDPLLCGGPEQRPTIVGPQPPELEKPLSKPAPAPRRPSSLCRIPDSPANGTWNLNTELCASLGFGSSDCQNPQGMQVEPGSRLDFTCADGHKPRENSYIHCESDGRWSGSPGCSEIKCGSLNSPSTLANCFTRSGNWLTCDPDVPPRTRATVSCRNGYKKFNTITSQTTYVVCNANGNWEPDAIECIPDCGKAITPQTPLVINGTRANVGEFPWHASLYLERAPVSSEKSRKDFICGATIIHSNFLMTAAHCVYNEATKTMQDPTKLFVATGNTFRDYDYQFHNNRIVSKRAVKNVFRYCKYYGIEGNYASDIALLELRVPFVFSTILLPACLYYDGYDEQILEQGITGRVAGFGRTATGESSGVLQTITIPYIPYHECKKSRNAETNGFLITNDKFCAGYNNGSAVCEGDSGGGLVVQRGELWYVMGIVSVGLGVNLKNGEKTCDSYSYTLFTRVSRYLGWMLEIIRTVQGNRSIAPCNSDVSDASLSLNRSDNMALYVSV